MKRSLEEEQEHEVKTCTKRFCLGHVAPGARLSLDYIQAELTKIQAWTDAVASWTSLSAPVVGVENLVSEWLKDYFCGHYTPHSNSMFLRFVRHVLAGVYLRAHTDVVTRIMDKYLERLKYEGPHWESPIELLIGRLFFFDAYQEDFLDLARELVRDPNELIGLCCWAIVARQMTSKWAGQMDYTRAAVANLVALILVLKNGPTFTYSSTGYDFVFHSKAGTPLTIWMPDFARFWFGVEMPDFCEHPSRIEQFHELLRIE
jgi:hypothetical protein